jgi:hypothetical protein
MSLSSDVCLNLLRNEFFPLLQGWKPLGFKKLVQYLTPVMKFFDFCVKLGDSVQSNRSPRTPISLSVTFPYRFSEGLCGERKFTGNKLNES